MKDCLQRDGWLLSASRTLTAPIDDNSPDAIEQLDARIRHINLICRLLTNGIKLPEVDKFKRAALQLEWDARNHSRSVDGSDKQGEQQQQLHEAWTSVAEKAHTLSDSLTQTASIQASTILSRPSTGASSILSLSRGSVHSLSPPADSQNVPAQQIATVVATPMHPILAVLPTSPSTFKQVGLSFTFASYVRHYESLRFQPPCDGNTVCISLS